MSTDAGRAGIFSVLVRNLAASRFPREGAGHTPAPIISTPPGAARSPGRWVDDHENLPSLVHLHKGGVFAELAPVLRNSSPTTNWRYVRRTTRLLAQRIHPEAEATSGIP